MKFASKAFAVAGAAALITFGTARLGSAGTITWHIESSQNPTGPLHPRLFGVACPAAVSCFAVGESDQASSFPVRRLVERWDGSAWKIEVTPAPPSGVSNTEFYGISCSAAGACTAVGDAFADESFRRPLIERWDGHT